MIAGQLVSMAVDRAGAEAGKAVVKKNRKEHKDEYDMDDIIVSSMP